MSIYYIWITALAVGLAFRIWYDNWRGPMSAEEIAKYEAWLLSRDRLSEAERQALIEFLRADDGKDFIMLNVVQLQEGKISNPGNGTLEAPMQVLNGYARPFVSALMRRAGHPVVVADKIGGYIDSWNTPDDPGWSFISYMRYRSRRDLFALASAPAFADAHEYKLAAMAQTFNFPTRPRITGFLGVRMGVLLVLSLVASLATIAILITG